MSDKSRVTISIVVDLLTRLDDAAKKGHRSRSQQVSMYIERGLEAEAKLEEAARRANR